LLSGWRKWQRSHPSPLFFSCGWRRGTTTKRKKKKGEGCFLRLEPQAYAHIILCWRIADAPLILYCRLSASGYAPLILCCRLCASGYAALILYCRLCASGYAPLILCCRLCASGYAPLILCWRIADAPQLRQRRMRCASHPLLPIDAPLILHCRLLAHS
jgi:hypothetical protein